MHQLNLELLEQLDVACGWILDNHITIPNSSLLASLLAKAKALLRELQSTEPKIMQYQKLSDKSCHSNRRKVTDFRNDDKETEPARTLYRGFL
jgi:cytoplasmic iron level regulating protein YaaA (DUF328/UPF0246 family)